MTTETNNNTLTIQRTFNAPRQLVWDVWTQPEHISNWYGPKGFRTRVETMDFKPGGQWRYIMIGPNGREMPVVGIFEEIIEPEKIITKDEYRQPGETGPATKFLITTVLFEDQGDQTKLTLNIKFPSEADRTQYEQMGAVHGWNSSFEKMDDLFNKLN